MLTIEIIDDSIHKIMYGETVVLVMYDEPYKNYVNATKLCKLDGKDYKNWCRNDRSVQLLEYICKAINPHINKSSEIDKIVLPIVLITGGSNKEIKGTYVHPVILNQMLSFFSVEFSLSLQHWVSNIASTYNLQINHVTPSKKIVSAIYSEKEWLRTLTKYYKKIDLDVYPQYEIGRFIIDAFAEDDNSMCIFEFDEKDHRSYDVANELCRYKHIRDVFQWTSKCIRVIRFSDSCTYSVQDICNIMKHIESVTDRYYILYVNYRKVCRLDELISSYTIGYVSCDTLV